METHTDWMAAFGLAFEIAGVVVLAYIILFSSHGVMALRRDTGSGEASLKTRMALRFDAMIGVALLVLGLFLQFVGALALGVTLDKLAAICAAVAFGLFVYFHYRQHLVDMLHAKEAN